MEPNSGIPVAEKKESQFSQNKMGGLYAWDQQAVNRAFLTGNYYNNYQTLKKLNRRKDDISEAFNNNFCSLR